jgi:hypothetical protein
MKKSFLFVGVLFALASVGLLIASGCGALKALSGAELAKEPVKLSAISPNLSEFAGKPQYDGVMETVVAPQIKMSDAKAAVPEPVKKYNDIFYKTAKSAAAAKQLRFGLEQLKANKVPVKVDKSKLGELVAGAVVTVAYAADRNMTAAKENASAASQTAKELADADTRYVVNLLAFGKAAVPMMQNDIKSLSESVQSLKPQEEFKGGNVTFAPLVADGVAQTSANLSAASKDIAAIADLMKTLMP